MAELEESCGHLESAIQVRQSAIQINQPTWQSAIQFSRQLTWCKHLYSLSTKYCIFKYEFSVWFLVIIPSFDGLNLPWRRSSSALHVFSKPSQMACMYLMLFDYESHCVCIAINFLANWLCARVMYLQRLKEIYAQHYTIYCKYRINVSCLVFYLRHAMIFFPSCCVQDGSPEAGESSRCIYT